MWDGMPAWASSVLRGAHTQYGYVQALYDGNLIHVDYGTGINPSLPSTSSSGFYPGPGIYPGASVYPSAAIGGATPVPIEVYPTGIDSTWLPLNDGSVQVSGGTTPGVRRTLTVSLAQVPGLFDALSVPGVELLAFSVVAGPSGQRVTIPQGVFPVDTTKMGYAANGTIEITAPDRWSRVQAGRFLIPRASWNGATARQQIANLVMQVMPNGSTYTDVATSSATVPAQTWDRDRDKAVADVAAAASIDAYFDRYGQLVIRDVPTLADVGVWTVDAAAGGVLMGADRQRDRQKTYNLVVVNSTTTNGTALFDPVFIFDDQPSSPTYAGPDPVGHPELAGPFGVRPTFYSSPLITDHGQAVAAGLTLLQRVTGLETQLTLTAAPHPGLDDGDTIQVVLPPERYDLPPVQEMHLVDSFNVPLRPDKGTAQTLATRSTRPDTVQDS